MSDVGNTFSNAYQLNGDYHTEGSVGGSDTNDYFSFVAAASGVANIDLYNLTDDIDLRLYNSSYQEIASSTAWWSSPENISYSVNAGQLYYIHIDPFWNSQSSYSLDVDLPEAIINSVNLDAGNTFNSAERITIDYHTGGSVGGE